MESNGPRILIIDDELQIRRLLKVGIGAYKYDIFEAVNGQAGLEGIIKYKPDLVILDLSLPDIDGLEVLRRIREWSSVPVIILSAKDLERDKVVALNNGADDYVSKPFGMGELVARIGVALRHTAKSEDGPILVFDDLKLDFAKRIFTLNNEEVKLTPTEYELLKVMATCAGKVLTHRQLLKAVWGPNYESEINYLRVYVAQLRNKIEIDPTRPKHILTELGIGYRFM
ncbi:response regulator [Dehalobacter sp. DCM]|uniref:response regulator n=1 Tax=Dehalobacter sp. DCM TaxID=2907827 RepID=UPI003081B86D|nr:response regulator [Dehalobacter sp. DCM]